jgi:hypothetical protein
MRTRSISPAIAVSVAYNRRLTNCGRGKGTGASGDSIRGAAPISKSSSRRSECLENLRELCQSVVGQNVVGGTEF